MLIERRQVAHIRALAMKNTKIHLRQSECERAAMFMRVSFKMNKRPKLL